MSLDKLKSDKIYVMETNFYNSSGFKLNETARSYFKLASDIKKLNNICFIWITDGKGWHSVQNNLKEAYNVTEHLYILTDLENNVLNKDVFKYKKIYLVVYY